GDSALRRPGRSVPRSVGLPERPAPAPATRAVGRRPVAGGKDSAAGRARPVRGARHGDAARAPPHGPRGDGIALSSDAARVHRHAPHRGAARRAWQNRRHAPAVVPLGERAGFENEIRQAGLEAGAREKAGLEGAGEGRSAAPRSPAAAPEAASLAGRRGAGADGAALALPAVRRPGARTSSILRRLPHSVPIVATGGDAVDGLPGSWPPVYR